MFLVKTFFRARDHANTLVSLSQYTGLKSLTSTQDTETASDNQSAIYEQAQTLKKF